MSPAPHENWLKASINGLDSISPIVPPNSMMQTSGGPSLPSTGISATRLIHS
uniref:Uncharacterized protein n=1 Tax=Arundo donax TaxID=35708 RepID=A0A0A9H5Z3_ARUDO